MEPNNNELYIKSLTNTQAFNSLEEISHSYKQSLSKSILKFVEDKDDGLLMSEILEKYGSYIQIHNQVKQLMLDNKLVIYEMKPLSITNQNYQALKVKVVDPSISKWEEMAAQPCLTCPIIGECAINNPVSPATCEEFNFWLDSEVELEMYKNQ